MQNCTYKNDTFTKLYVQKVTRYRQIVRTKLHKYCCLMLYKVAIACSITSVFDFPRPLDSSSSIDPDDSVIRRFSRRVFLSVFFRVVFRSLNRHRSFEYFSSSSPLSHSASIYSIHANNKQHESTRPYTRRFLGPCNLVHIIPFSIYSHTTAIRS